ncbi:MAG: glycine--tRNA ligase [Verrucomicrobia bacterium]|jgi:glycyl-tRNA synthetase|nr:glycine--tRNA ligase [Verrucomicrobiota bacterium]|tara:strand:+ start:37827 stop:39443 length:1617 start_codon:yes stop_codon:yes gene_type:complete
MANKDVTDPVRMEKIVSLCKRRGFIFQAGELYGGLNGCWDYGPLGTELKRNLKDYWWRKTVQERDDVLGMDGSILTMEEVLQSSGHIGGFSDPMATCKQCQKHIRFDQLRESVAESPWAQSLAGEMTVTNPGEIAATAITGEQLKRWANKNGKKLAPGLALVRTPEITISFFLEEAERHQPMDPWYFYQLMATEQFAQTGPQNPCPNCGGVLGEPKQFELMFKTNMGATGGDIAYLRPETAQSIFCQYKNVLDSNRIKLPFGIAQVGKSFRNEINPRNFTFRSREFEQMEIEYFCHPDQGMQLTEDWLETRLTFYAEIGIPREKLHILDVPDGERAFYAKKTYDIEYEFPFGIQELEGVAYRTDYDLGVHAKGSGRPLEYFDEETKERFLPHVVEPSAGCDRTVLALICEAFDEENLGKDGKNDVRTVMRFKPSMAPIKVALFPLLKKNEEQVRIAKEIQKQLQPWMNVFYDETGAVGRRYRRQDEVGTPFCITIDFETLGEENPDLKGTVTIRHRDSMEQERLAIEDILPWLLARVR